MKRSAIRKTLILTAIVGLPLFISACHWHLPYGHYGGHGYYGGGYHGGHHGGHRKHRHHRY